MMSCDQTSHSLRKTGISADKAGGAAVFEPLDGELEMGRSCPSKRGRKISSSLVHKQLKTIDFRNRRVDRVQSFGEKGPFGGKTLPMALQSSNEKSLLLLALQLLFLSGSESMGNHDSIIVDAGSVD